MLAVFCKSDLEIPQPLPKLFSLYLLLAIGFKGGYELAQSGMNTQIALTLIASIVMALVVPVYSFFILRLKLDAYNAAAIAATYGSISAVTFITASSFLEKLEISYGGHMVASLALMESPAIIIGIILVRVFAPPQDGETEPFSWGKVLHESFLNGSVFLLVGSLIIGLLTGEKGWEKLEPFTQGIFYGALTFFLLDMGLVAAKRIRELQKTGSFLIGFS
ncbi:MAG: sodium-dependent bicarbonate transport family permease, partial [Planktothrix sp.]